MNPADLVAVHPGWRRALPWLPVFIVAGRVYVCPCGETYRAVGDGRLEQLHRGGRPRGGAASDPAHSGRPRRYP